MVADKVSARTSGRVEGGKGQASYSLQPRCEWNPCSDQYITDQVCIGEKRQEVHDNTAKKLVERRRGSRTVRKGITNRG